MASAFFVIGLTGQSGAGKSQVCNLLLNRGFRVIDADVVARRVVEKGKRCLVELVLEFGVEILLPDSTLNRRKLGKIVFNDKEKLTRLNQIIFPHITAEIRSQIDEIKATGAPAVFLDAPTLFESGSDKICDKVISVVAPEWLRLRRVVARDEITEQEAKSRMRSQYSEEFFIKRSDYVIENIGDIANLRDRVLEMLRHLGIKTEIEIAHAE